MPHPDRRGLCRSQRAALCNGNQVGGPRKVPKSRTPRFAYDPGVGVFVNVTLARVPDGFDFFEPLRLLFEWVEGQGSVRDGPRRRPVRLTL